MPIHRGVDSQGPFYRYGHQTKYRYVAGDKKSRDAAYGKCHKQAVAIKISQKRSGKKIN